MTDQHSTQEEPFTLKEALFNPETVAAFARAIHDVYPSLESQVFLNAVFDDAWNDRALKDRMRHVTVALHEHLPADYRSALQILLEALPNLPEGGFISMVPSDYVEVYGLDDPEASIPALEQFTQPASAEFAVRPFIDKYPERMMAQMLAWADHDQAAVRRLASEGCRPRLPWGIRLHRLVEDPSPILPILEKLKHDDSESVRRSVANNLNDISKDNPDLVLDRLGRWNAAEGDDKEIRWITQHALRTLLKSGDKQALELLGYPAEPQLIVHDVRVEPATLPIGAKVTLSFEIESTGDSSQNLMIDYLVYHLRANGQQTPKVFKLKKVSLGPGQIVKVERAHSFRPVTTRKYYPGPHAIRPQINGQMFERVDFELTE